MVNFILLFTQLITATLRCSTWVSKGGQLSFLCFLKQQEIVIFLLFLGPDTVNKILFLGPEMVQMVQQRFWAQKLTKRCNFWAQKPSEN